MTDVVIRASRPSDMPTVADLRWRWRLEEDGEPSSVTIEEFRDAMTAFARAHPDSHRCVVAERDGAVVGMAWLAVTPRPPVPDRLHRTTADLQTVYVQPDARGSGIAGRLVRRLLDEADADGVERVTVHSSVVGEGLYRQLGFGDARLLLQRPAEA